MERVELVRDPYKLPNKRPLLLHSGLSFVGQKDCMSKSFLETFLIRLNDITIKCGTRSQLPIQRLIPWLHTLTCLFEPKLDRFYRSHSTSSLTSTMSFSFTDFHVSTTQSLANRSSNDNSSWKQMSSLPVSLLTWTNHFVGSSIAQ